MTPINLPLPPDPMEPRFAGNPIAWQRAAFDWMQRTRGLVQNAHNDAIRPAGQAMLAQNYTLNTIATGTMTTTDMANVVATLIATLTAKGILSPTTSRTS